MEVVLLRISSHSLVTPSLTACVCMGVDAPTPLRLPFSLCAPVCIPPSPSSPRLSAQVVDMDQPLFFHAICGENTEISQDQHVAQRLRPLDEFTNATVFSCRPLKADEWFEIVVSGVVDTWNGSVQLGEERSPS